MDVMMQHEATIRDRIPADIVYDYDFVHDAGLIQDPFERMKSLHREAPPLFFSPRYGGHWVVTSRALLQEIRSEEHTSELQSLMRISYAVFCLKKKTKNIR